MSEFNINYHYFYFSPTPPLPYSPTPLLPHSLLPLDEKQIN
ncbi:MAG: hypothetical protein SWX82_18690 [Cyanobacteriota bacterium]|nr:hypothetical protein [Cyanobacteriota bacterium]